MTEEAGLVLLGMLSGATLTLSCVLLVLVVRLTRYLDAAIGN